MTIISYSPVVHSLVSGRLDTLLKIDHGAYDSINRIEEQAEINWLKNNMNAGFQFDLKHEENKNHSDIRQLFFTHKIAAIDYTLGRFNRSDKLGYYMLDGAVVNYQQKEWRAGFYSGKPLQIENYNTIDAHRIYGADINHHVSYKKTSLINKLDSYIGWQQIKSDEEQNYIHWGVSSEGQLDNNKFNQLEMIFSGSYITDNKYTESINAVVQAHSEDYGLARVSFITWQPKQSYLSFKEQFYSVYANGSQSVLQADFFRNYKWNKQYYIRGRKVWREYGNDGYGLSLGFDKKKNNNKNLDWKAQWDSLILQDDYIHSLYLGINKNISATLRGYFNAAVQYQHKQQSAENNTTLALEARAEHMLSSSLFVDFNARYIYNNNKKNEYQLGFNLSYRFDDRIRSRK